MSASRRSFTCVVVTLSLCLLLVACQFGDMFFDSGEPQPSEWTLDSATVQRDFQEAGLPILSAEVVPGRVKVDLAYDYEQSRTASTRFEADIKAIVKLMCKYDRGYSLETTYTNQMHFKLEDHFITGQCDGIGAVVPEDQLVDEGYLGPLYDAVTSTPTQQK